MAPKGAASGSRTLPGGPGFDGAGPFGGRGCYSRVPHVLLNPLFQEIPELDPTKGGSLIGSSRDFVDPEKRADLDLIISRLRQLKIEGLICVGGDGTLNGLQPLVERLPTVLAPRTIDNDLGLNHPSESDEFVRINDPAAKGGFRYKQTDSRVVFDPEYLLPIFTDAIGEDDMEHVRQTLFAAGNLTQPYHSINTDVNKRIRFLEAAAPATSGSPS